MCGVAPGGDDRHGPGRPTEARSRVAVTTPIGQQALRAFAGASRRPRAADRNRGSRVCSRCVTSAGDAASRDAAPRGEPLPSTRTIHFVPWPRVLVPTWGPPLVAGTTLPSTTHSSPRSLCRSFSLAFERRVQDRFPGVFELTNRVCGGLVHLYARCAGGSGGPRRHTPRCRGITAAPDARCWDGPSPSRGCTAYPRCQGPCCASVGSRLRRSGPGRP